MSYGRAQKSAWHVGTIHDSIGQLGELKGNPTSLTWLTFILLLVFLLSCECLDFCISDGLCTERIAIL